MWVCEGGSSGGSVEAVVVVCEGDGVGSGSVKAAAVMVCGGGAGGLCEAS